MEEPKDFISWIGIVPDPRIVGMVYEHAVPELRSDDPLLFAEAMADPDEVQVRLRAALTAAFGNTV
jgi:hypothetical protein